jgi:murein DD-endopeptidase MepM/ murein hydrolase activator NlpD
MQILITHSSMARTRVLQFRLWQVVAAVALAAAALMLFSGAVYHFVFLKAAREGWPLVSPIVRLVVRDEIAQRDRFMRENLDAIAQKVGETQAKLVKLEAVGERVSGLAGVKPGELQPLQRPAAGPGTGGGKGGLYIPLERPTLEQLQTTVTGLDEAADQTTDIFTLIESRLFEARLQALMVPNSQPVEGPVGSGFGFRSDPITGRAALHTGLDFPAESGTPIRAAAGGVVVSAEYHPQYGYLLELDHGNGLKTLYAHTSNITVRRGDIVKRGQTVAAVGTSGRSTGPHLHFEVLVEGVPQDPARFLAQGRAVAAAPEKSSRRR